jgi:peptidyl-dipeptidase Dcp
LFSGSKTSHRRKSTSFKFVLRTPRTISKFERATLLLMSSHATHNPLLVDWTSDYGLPPFAQTKPEHYAPAFDVAFAKHRAELDAIASSSDAPTFANTIVAFDRAGWLFNRLNDLFGNLTAAETSDALQAVERELVPKVAAHRSSIYMDEKLFARIDVVKNSAEAKSLAREDSRLLNRIHFDFVRQGAKIAKESRARYAANVSKLAELSTQFAQNVLKDESDWALWLNESDLTGLSPSQRDAARAAATTRGKPDAYAITLSRSSVVPFLTFSERRDLREIAFNAWISRGAHDGASDNRKLAVEILKLRAEQAKMHGYASFADYALVDRMAKTPQAARDLLTKAWIPAKAKMAQDGVALDAMRMSQGVSEPLAKWDWRFYAEKVRKARFDLDDAEVKPFFELNAMMRAMFGVAGKLFGISFVEKHGAALYHSDVRLFEVRRGSDLVGIFLSDNFARPTKQGGAWMSAYRSQTRNTVSGAVIPIVGNHNNFSKPPEGQPALLTFDDVRTLFHEFGHGLHGLLSNVNYEKLSGTNVLQDYVELPSQLYEHWALEPTVLAEYARHYQTNEPIPAALIERIRAAANFNKAYETVEYTSSALVDLAVHSRDSYEHFDLVQFESEELARLGMPALGKMMHRLPHFRHLFSGDSYAAGYYVYMWAEVLDADAFDAFVEAGNSFDAETAKRLHDFVYSAGDSIEPADGYRAFRGRDASVEPMLKKRGLIAV